MAPMIAMPLIGRIALEHWRASGPRTLARLESLVHAMGETYYGSSERWPPCVRVEVTTAADMARLSVNAWELAS